MLVSSVFPSLRDFVGVNTAETPHFVDELVKKKTQMRMSNMKLRKMKAELACKMYGSGSCC